jgi:cyclic pyranopterin phosphate synthase
VGVIPSVSKPFCGDCDRVRITADGQFRTCLFATTEFDLRKLMRQGADDDVVAAEIQRAVGTKWAGHQINQVSFVRPKRTMSQIGG